MSSYPNAEGERQGRLGGVRVAFGENKRQCGRQGDTGGR